jgi:pimeloyl-ACP methyl ester carboxylesterase
MTVLRVSRAVIVGVDLGGDVAMKLAANRADRVEKLVLINTPAFDELPAKDITQMQRRTARFAFSLTRGVMGAAPLLEGVLTGSVANPEHMPMKLVARYLASFVGKDGANHLLTLASSIHRGDLDEDEYGEIKAPTLIVWGDEDKWVDPKLADRLVNAIPDARLVRLAGVARLVPEENPEHLSELLLDFIKKRAAA